MIKILKPIAAGIVATLAMDVLNALSAALGFVSKVSHEAIGRLISAWFQGRFLFEHPTEIPQFEHATLLGYFYHYSIGVIFAFVFIAAHRFQYKSITLRNTLLFSLATAAFSLFLAFPSMGLGMLGLKAGSEPLKMSLLNHAFYGLGLYLACWFSLSHRLSQPSISELKLETATSSTTIANSDITGRK